ncbi:MAG: aldo/keto reductase [Pseudomonadales bacterium]
MKAKFSPDMYRPLGQTGLEVAPLSLGAVKLGRNTGVKYPQGFELPTDAEVRRLLEHARRLGINLIDTAPAYGSSEDRLGQLLPGPREDWIISTKTGEQHGADGSSWDYSRKATQASVARSLKRLKTDYLDLALVHSNGADREVIEQTPVLETLASLKDKGDIRAIGFSGKSPTESRLALPLVDVLMVPLSETDPSHLPLIAEAADAGKGVLLKKIFDSGHATDPASAIRYAVNVAGVSSAVIGSLSEDHLSQNVLAACAH